MMIIALAMALPLFAAAQDSGTTRTVEGKTFQLRMGVWVDPEYNSITMADDLRTIRYLSGEYLHLMERHPGILPYLALGQRLILVHKGEAIAITPGH